MAWPRPAVPHPSQALRQLVRSRPGRAGRPDSRSGVPDAAAVCVCARAAWSGGRGPGGGCGAVCSYAYYGNYATVGMCVAPWLRARATRRVPSERDQEYLYRNFGKIFARSPKTRNFSVELNYSKFVEIFQCSNYMVLRGEFTKACCSFVQNGSSPIEQDSVLNR